MARQEQLRTQTEPSIDALLRESGKALDRIRRDTPLVQCMTNVVTVNLVANAILAIHGSPAMCAMPGEAEEMVAGADALLVNLGAMDPDQRISVHSTVRRAREAATPWVLDPVGAGPVLTTRTRLARDLLEQRPAVIRGNASEIIALAGDGSSTRGVDSADSPEDARRAAVDLARLTGGAVAVSGPTDLVTDGRRILRAFGGSPWLARITGSGCSLGGVTAALAARSGPLAAALAATLAYNAAAERAAAASSTRGPASFQMNFLDALFAVTPDDVAGQRLALEHPDDAALDERALA